MYAVGGVRVREFVKHRANICFSFFPFTGYGVFIKDRAEVSVFDSEVICVVWVCLGGGGRKGRRKRRNDKVGDKIFHRIPPLTHACNVSLSSSLPCARAVSLSLCLRYRSLARSLARARALSLSPCLSLPPSPSPSPPPPLSIPPPLPLSLPSLPSLPPSLPPFPFPPSCSLFLSFSFSLALSRALSLTFLGFILL